MGLCYSLDPCVKGEVSRQEGERIADTVCYSLSLLLTPVSTVCQTVETGASVRRSTRDEERLVERHHGLPDGRGRGSWAEDAWLGCWRGGWTEGRLSYGVAARGGLLGCVRR